MIYMTLQLDTEQLAPTIDDWAAQGWRVHTLAPCPDHGAPAWLLLLEKAKARP